MSRLLRRAGLLALGIAGLLLAILSPSASAYTLPPTPTTFLTDEAGVIDASTAQTINQQLAQFERDTTNQILVAIYPALPDDAEIAQYATQTYNQWQVGQKGRNNGAVLFVFVNSHKMFIVTGRGLEGALPDAICKRIVRDVITPSFRQGNYAAGVEAGVTAMLAATRGEFKAPATTEPDQSSSDSQGIPVWAILIFVLIFILFQIFGPRRYGPSIYTGSGPYYGGGGFGGGGGGGGFGGFSGGGGSSAGGGAGGGW